MRHILERHHPQFWNGESKPRQTFFDPRLTPDDIAALVTDALKQNREKISNLSPNELEGQFFAVIDGVEYTVGLSDGKVGQFYPNL